ncbi:MAG: GNAT family protein [Alphaproteobacteria bacterium]|nr:GNAT family protein [Alphaproteobacteria bacterium]
MLKLPIFGTGLFLREMAYSDIPRIYEIASTPGFCFNFLTSGNATKEAIIDSAEHFMFEAYETKKPDPLTNLRECYKLAIVEIANPQSMVGFISIDEWSERRGKKREIRYFVDPREQGKGIATEASMLLLDRFFEVSSFDHIAASVQPGAPASQRIFEKLGARPAGLQTVTVNGTPETYVEMSLFRDDYFKATEKLRPQKPAARRTLGFMFL